VWNEPGVSLLLSGMNGASQVDENLRVADAARAGALSADELCVYDDARAAMRARMKADCSACRYCQPCPSGVEIPEVLAALNAASMWDAADPWLTGYTRIGGRPDACTECGQCEDMCPQGLPIRELLKETEKIFAK
jgi:predicted aldo/keto reductase-like oxidoreductase